MRSILTVRVLICLVALFLGTVAAARTPPVVVAAAEVRGGGAAAAPRRGKGRGSGSDCGTGPLGTFLRTVRDARRHLAAAAAARSSSILLMYPVDTIKTRMQVGQADPLRAAGLYRGVGGSLAGQVPYGVLTFGSYEVYKRALLERFPGARPVFLYAAAAVLGDLTGSGWLCPSEVVKQKMQAGMYKSTGQAVASILRTKGLVGLYEGYFGGIARDVPFRVSQLCSYEVTKNLYLRLKANRRAASQAAARSRRVALPSLELSPLETAVCGAVSGSFSAAITAPLDRIKTLLMTDSAAHGGTVASCAAQIWRQQGIAGFFEGVVPRVVYIAPSVVCFFIVYEQVQQRLDHRLSK